MEAWFTDQKSKSLEIEDRIIENSGLLIKGVTQTTENETKEQRGGFLSMLLGTLGANLFETMLAGKE